MQWCKDASHLGERLGEPDEDEDDDDDDNDEDDGQKYHGEGDDDGDSDRVTVREAEMWSGKLSPDDRKH